VSGLARWIGGLLGALLLGAALVLGTRVPWTAEPEDEAAIRLSWRAVGEPIERCRVVTPEELEALPPHMRQREICERRLAPFRLRVSLDGADVADEEVFPSGARGDRPTYVFRELRVAPGSHHLKVQFQALHPEGAPPPPPPLQLERTLELGPRAVALVAEDPDTAQLVLLER
jgi:hypothetical protein